MWNYDMKSIQDLINERAENRLNNELGIITKFFQQNSLLSLTDNPGVPEIYLEVEKGDKKEYIGQKPRWFFDNISIYLDKVKEYWLPIYQAEENKKFIDEVNNLKNSVENLLSTQPEEY